MKVKNDCSVLVGGRVGGGGGGGCSVFCLVLVDNQSRWTQTHTYLPESGHVILLLYVMC